MSSRVGVEKHEYVCIQGHLTRQRADKPKPKKCSNRGCDSKMARVGGEAIITDYSETNREETVVTPKPKVKRKVIRATEKKKVSKKK